MNKIAPVPMWLLVLLAGVPMLTETIYTPALTEIAHSLATQITTVEYTLSIYLFAFSLGTLTFGRLSDKFGRKNCVVVGLSIYLVGCISCYLSPSIHFLMISRLIQGFGASVGSVLSQAITRDRFKGADLGRVYSLIGGALAVFPALGPIIGGLIVHHINWRFIFFVLIPFAITTLLLTIWKLPETHPKEDRTAESLLRLLKKLASDKEVLFYGFVVGFSSGISFSYFAEAPYFLVEKLGLTPKLYGYSFVPIATSTFLGGFTSRRLQRSMTSKQVLHLGTSLLLIGPLFLLVIVKMKDVFNIPNPTMVFLTIFAQMINAFFINFAANNAMALALAKYKSSLGTASSLLGFYYYALISSVTVGMARMHNGTLYAMPMYFLTVAIILCLVSWNFRRYEAKLEPIG